MHNYTLQNISDRRILYRNTSWYNLRHFNENTTGVTSKKHVFTTLAIN